MLNDLDVRRKRFTLEEYDRLIDLGFFAEGDRIELIHGDLIEMSPKGTAHILCCRKLLNTLTQLFENPVWLQCHDPIVIPSSTYGSESEPDFTIFHHPLFAKVTPEQVLLVIEVSDSSLNYDRAVKGPLYASGQIPHYWIFNVLETQVECLSQPQQNAQGGWAYGLQQIILPNQMLALPGPLSGAIDLTKIFA
jgi:Uma2 family endonuclease